MPLILEHLNSPTDDARALIAELDAELAAHYATNHRHGLSFTRIFQPNVTFFIAYLDDHPVGCGGVSLDGDDSAIAEVKSMYVRPHARGRGVAQAILARIEQEARTRGAIRLALETGDAQHAACRFYGRAGFTRCSAFGQYAAMPPAAIERSVFFEKPI
jgi:putative acetyltransferase